jgi:hypothetical protein
MNQNTESNHSISETRNRIRWHVIFSIPAGLMGAFCLLGGILGVGVTAYYNVLYGPIADSGGEYEALDEIALSIRNILRINVYFGMGATGLMLSRLLYRRQLRGALIAGAIFISLCGLTVMLSNK